jgi:L-alanine-DL-glutamate epimerase-like enolase superfamily enzyme
MKITDLSVTLFERTGVGHVQYSPHNPPVTGRVCLGLVTVKTDSDLEGHAFIGTPNRTAELDAFSLVHALKPMVVGHDPLDREFLYRQISRRSKLTTWRAIGAVDVALWDLGGKIANLPIYKLMGGYRNTVPSYASSPGYTDLGIYREEAVRVKEAGYAGYKVHPPRSGWELDIRACEAVREAVGDDYLLMLDSSGMYDYPQAMTVGRAIEEMSYYWFEDPLPFEDIYGYTKLRPKLDIPLMATEASPGAFHSYTDWIVRQATDYLRGDVAIKGGLTSLLKTAHLADAFRMNLEIHHGGNSLNNVAQLHMMCAIQNSEFFEVILPDNLQKYGLVEDIAVDSKGNIRVPEGPGLGVEINFDLISKTTIGVLN